VKWFLRRPRSLPYQTTFAPGSLGLQLVWVLAADVARALLTQIRQLEARRLCLGRRDLPKCSWGGKGSTSLFVCILPALSLDWETEATEKVMGFLD
jgi:hypothetical protein